MSTMGGFGCIAAVGSGGCVNHGADCDCGTCRVGALRVVFRLRMSSFDHGYQSSECRRHMQVGSTTTCGW